MKTMIGSLIVVALAVGCAPAKKQIQPERIDPAEIQEQIEADLGPTIKKVVAGEGYATKADIRGVNNRMSRMEDRIIRNMRRYLQDYFPSK